MRHASLELKRPALLEAVPAGALLPKRLKAPPVAGAEPSHVRGISTGMMRPLL
jgi:hypothetical protein